MSAMTPQPKDLMKAQLKSPRWVNQVIAINYMQRRAEEKDVELVKALTKDKTPTVGARWKAVGQENVGAVAAKAVEAIGERLAQPEESSNDSKP